MSSSVLYLEPVGGIAGDMFLAASIDLGVSPAAIEAALSGLELPEWRLQVMRAQRHELAGTHVDVVVTSPAPLSHTPLKEVRARIRACGSMSLPCRERALAVFEALGAAEGKIHDVPVDDVYFHEVGAVDSIVDICGAAVALELLGDPAVFSASPPLGSGFAQMAHGRCPIPAPATLELLRGRPVRFEGSGELTTPTGAALLSVLARIEPPPELNLARVGYGVGTRVFEDRPNVLRASLGERVVAGEQAGAGAVRVLEANLDDCNPQLIGALLDELLTNGALDAYVSPVVMKKSRPGHLLAVIAPAERREALERVIFAGVTTLGIRSHAVDRTVLERRHRVVRTRYGDVRVKEGLSHGEVLNAHPEFEDCAARAREHGVPVKDVLNAAVTAYGGLGSATD